LDIVSLCCCQLVSRGTLCACTTICAGGRAASAATTASRRRGARGHHHRPRSGRPRHFVLRLGHPENVVVSAGGDAGGSGLPRAGVSTEAGRPTRVTRFPGLWPPGRPYKSPLHALLSTTAGRRAYRLLRGDTRRTRVAYPITTHYYMTARPATSNQQAAP